MIPYNDDLTNYLLAYNKKSALYTNFTSLFYALLLYSILKFTDSFPAKKELHAVFNTKFPLIIIQLFCKYICTQHNRYCHHHCNY